VLTNAEWNRLSAVLKRGTNHYIAPAVALLLVTTMRVSEALLRSRWEAVDLDRCILKLGRAKAGRREVPLLGDPLRIIFSHAEFM